MMQTSPVEGLLTSTKTIYKAIKITPAQTLLILRSVMGNMQCPETESCQESTTGKKIRFTHPRFRMIAMEGS
jgi:hypothetical protein